MKYSPIILALFIGLSTGPTIDAALAVDRSIALGACPENLAPIPYPDSFRCGKLLVYENRKTAQGRKIPLFVVVSPATEKGSQARAPLFFLNGGPGEANSPMAPLIAQWMTDLNRTRDMVFVDLRGTGGSNPLHCERIGPEGSLQKHMSYLLRVNVDVKPCVEALETKADLTQYNTTYAAADYNDVRDALGYEKFALLGGSYGTRLAQEIIRSFGEHVEAAVLFGVAPPDVAIPTGFANSFQVVLDRFFERCAANPECRESYPDLEEDFDHMIAQVRKHGASATVEHPATRERQTVRLELGEFAMGLRFLAYNAAAVVKLPEWITAGANGDFESLLQAIAGDFYGIHQRFFIGANNSFVCAEDLPFVDLEKERLDAADTLLGTYRMEQQLDTCALWPRGQVEPVFRSPVSSSVPVLLATGSEDPVTPPAHADRVGRTLSRSLHAVFEGRGHSIMEDGESIACFLGMLNEFLERGTLDGLQTDCARELKPMIAPGQDAS